MSCKKQIPESVLLAECVGDIRALLRQILSDTTTNRTPRPKGIIGKLEAYNIEHIFFVLVFVTGSAFYNSCGPKQDAL